MTAAVPAAPLAAVPAPSPALVGRDPRRVALAAAFGAGVLALTGAGVYAALSATATTTTPQAVASGTLSLTLADAANAAAFTDSVSGLAPGDVVRRHVDLVNGGTLDGRSLGLKVTATGDDALTSRLSVTVRSCSDPWDAAAGTCAGTVSQVLAATSLTALASTQALGDGSSAAGSTQHLQVELALADVDEVVVNGAAPAGTVQGRSAQLGYEFSTVQRTATTSSS